MLFKVVTTPVFKLKDSIFLRMINENSYNAVDNIALIILNGYKY